MRCGINIYVIAFHFQGGVFVCHNGLFMLYVISFLFMSYEGGTNLHFRAVPGKVELVF